MDRYIHRCAVLVLLCGVVVGCTRGDEVSFTPLVEQPSPELPGKFVWHNLITPDAEAARRFYGGVFGWEFDVQGDGKYTEVSYGGRSLGGIVHSTGEGAAKTAVWLSGISVPAVDKALEAAVAQGAEPLIGVTEIANVGKIAVVSDPQGAVLQLVRSTVGDPPDGVAALNTWLWHELIANDTAVAASFYETVFGYRVATLGADGEDAYRLLTRDGKPRAGILENPFDKTRPAWVPYVRVADPAALLSKVTALGGKVVIAPRPDLRGGMLAVILDPAGAPLALQRWNPATEGEGS